MKSDYHHDVHQGYYAPGGYGYPQDGQAYGYAVEPYHQYAPVVPYRLENEIEPGSMESWVNFRNSSYLKGFVVGAGVALVLTNPSVQKALVAGVVKLWSAVQGSVEEVKEQIQDIKAEMSQKG